MTWTAPMTAVAHTAFPASDYNVHVRDNFLETMPAKATGTSGYFVNSATNTITRRDAVNHVVTTAQSVLSTSYVDLATVGPTVTVTTGTKALVHIAARMSATAGSAAQAGHMAIAISGATTTAATDAISLRREDDAVAGTYGNRCGVWHLYTSLTAGSNTFTAKYKSELATAGNEHLFANRELIVIPLS